MKTLLENVNKRFGTLLRSADLSAVGEVTITIPAEKVIEVCTALRDDTLFKFEQMMDVTAVDYLAYGDTEWSTESATQEGFSRGRVHKKDPRHAWQSGRFAVVYHLLSVSLNQRIRVKAFVDEDMPIISSVVNIWSVANWFEREAFDMFGIIFEGHPDLRRILTDYGFIGHPFRKDFPLFGEVEMRYDETKKRVVYEPVTIEERVLVPRVIRDDNRYIERSKEES